MFELINNDIIIKQFSEYAHSQNVELYVVGGCVRDELFGVKRDNPDFDLCSALPISKVVEFANLHGVAYKIKNKKLEVVAIYSGDLVYEHARLRREAYETKSSHTPTKVEFISSIEEDAKRRDFTINSIYYARHSTNIIDPLGGVNDIKNRILKTTLGAEKTLSVDPARILRLIELASRFDLKVDEETAMIANRYATNVFKLSRDRLKKEIKRIYTEKKYYNNNDNGYLLRVEKWMKFLNLQNLEDV